MVKNVNQRIYSNLDKILGGLEEFMHSKEGCVHIKSIGYLSLIIERLSANEISLAHYIESDGDLVADPYVTARIDFENKKVEVLTHKNKFGNEKVYLNDGSIDFKAQKSNNSFLNQWLLLVKKHGFKRVTATKKKLL